MSILQVANVQFDSTGANRIEYTGNNVIRVKGAGLQLPVVTNATKPSAEPGMMLYNSDTGNMEMMGAGGAGLSFASNSSVASVFAVANAGFGKSNTALQNTSGTFAGALTVTGGVSVPNEGSGGYYTALNASGTNKIILSISNNGMATNATRLRSAGGGVSIEDSGASTLMSVLENGNIGVGISPITDKFVVKANTNLNFGVGRDVAVGNSICLQAYNDARSLNVPMEIRASSFYFTIPTGNPMTIGANGNIGVGTTTPTFKFQVNQGNAYANGYSWFATNSGTGVPPNISFGLLLGTNYSGGLSETNLIWGQGISSSQYFAIGKTTGSVYTEQMRIDSSGRVTKPYMPAFSGETASFAATSSTGGNHRSGINYGNQFGWPNAQHLVNNGSNWNTTTGRFTAPVAGYYQFNLVGHKDVDSTGRTIMTFAVNGVETEMVECYGNYQDAGGSVMLYLNANDWAEAGTNNGLRVTRVSFSGFLIG